MLSIGTKILDYTVIAAANGVAMAKKDNPCQYMIFYTDDLTQWLPEQVFYYNNKTKAEEAFCAQAFWWFEDNANIELTEGIEISEESFLDKAADVVAALDNASEAIRQMLREEHGIKANTPQEVAAECNGNISFAMAAAVCFEKMVKRKIEIMLVKYAEAVKDLNDETAKLDNCCFLRDTAAKLTEECVVSILANIRDVNSLFF